MKISSKLIIAATIILLVIILVGIYASYHTFAAVFMRLDETVGYWLSLTIVIILIAFCAAVSVAAVLALWFIVIEIQGRKRKHQRFAPTEQGYYEALLIADKQGQQLFLKPADNIPLLMPSTYSPHITIESPQQLPALPPPALPQSTEQPQLATIIDEITPNALEFIYGLNPATGELIKTTLPKAVHIQLLGASGQGKSRQATSILTQLTTRNDTGHLQLALVDCENETTTPFQNLPHVLFLADEPKEAAKTFRSLVGELERRDITKQIYPVILVFVEEFLNLRRTMPEAYRDQALEDYTTLALRGRKRGLFLFSIGQTAYTDKHIRDAQNQFLSSMAFAVKPTAARSAGFTNTELLNKLYAERRPGQFLLERPAGDSILLAPYVDTSLVTGLLASRDTDAIRIVESDQQPANNTPRNQLDGALQAKLTQVMQLHTKGLGKGEIIQAVWGVTPGTSKAYKQAQEEYTKLMQYLMQHANEKIGA